MDPVRAAETLRYHLRMLGDRDRLQQYRRAIHQAVRPGDVVVDVGSGSGILALIACAAGARRVYAIEAGEVVRLAEALVRQNGMEDRVVFLRGASFEIELPEPADVLVTETMGNLGVDEGIVQIVADARERMLRDGARIVPSSIEVLGAPVQMDEFHRSLDQWPREVEGIDLAPLTALSANNIHRLPVPAEAVVAEPQSLFEFHLTTAERLHAQTRAGFRAAAECEAHGLAAWFSADLGGGIRLSNEPGRKTHWGQAVFPFEVPVPMRPGDLLDVSLQVRNEGASWRWTAGPAGGAPVLDQSTVWGFPLPLP